MTTRKAASELVSSSIREKTDTTILDINQEIRKCADKDENECFYVGEGLKHFVSSVAVRKAVLNELRKKGYVSTTLCCHEKACVGHCSLTISWAAESYE